MKLYAWWEADERNTYHCVAVAAASEEEARKAAIAAYREANKRAVFDVYPEHYDGSPDLVQNIVEGQTTTVFFD